MPFEPRLRAPPAFVLVKRDPETLEIRDIMVCPSDVRAMLFMNRNPEWEVFHTHVIEHPSQYGRTGVQPERGEPARRRAPGWPGVRTEQTTLERQVGEAIASAEHIPLQIGFWRLKDETDPHKILGIRPDADRKKVEAAFQQCIARVVPHAEDPSNPRWVIEAAQFIKRKYVLAREELLSRLHPPPEKEET